MQVQRNWLPVLLTALSCLCQPLRAEIGQYRIETLASGLHFPWSVAVMPDGSYLLTERSGQLRKVTQGQVPLPVGNVPKVFFQGQGGLMDVVLHPDYKDNGWLYLTYAHGDETANHLRLLRARLVDHMLVDQQILFTAQPAKATPVHYGGRLAFLPDNSLVITSGDGFDYREQAQNPASHLGKLIRLMDDGSLPDDNPQLENGAAGLYSLGHRNPQGIAWDPVSEQLYINEHGPKGGDEINLIRPGNNYGWPVITLGIDYSGARISPFTSYPGMIQPLVDWTPSIAPSALVIYRGEMFPDLVGSLLSTTLKSREVRMVKLQGTALMGQQSLFTEIGERLRDIEVGPAGEIYLLTDAENGRLLKVTAQ